MKSEISHGCGTKQLLHEWTKPSSRLRLRTKAALGSVAGECCSRPRPRDRGRPVRDGVSAQQQVRARAAGTPMSMSATSIRVSRTRSARSLIPGMFYSLDQRPGATVPAGCSHGRTNAPHRAMAERDGGLPLAGWPSVGALPKMPRQALSSLGEDVHDALGLCWIVDEARGPNRSVAERDRTRISGLAKSHT